MGTDTTTKEGDYLQDQSEIKTENEDIKSLSKSIDSTISQDDIWEMWKEKPPSNVEIKYNNGEKPKDDEGYYKKDTDVDKIVERYAMGAAKVFAASRRGRSHAHTGKFRDDHFIIKHLPETGCYILAVADGAGSAKYSRKGSEIACIESVKFIETYIQENSAVFGEKFLKDCESICLSKKPKSKEVAQFCLTHLFQIFAEAVFAAKRKIAKEAERLVSEYEKITERDFNTTILLAICKKLKDGQWFIGSFGIGDGTIAIYKPFRQPFRLMNTPDGGEYAGETSFLTTENVWQDKKQLLRRFHAVVVPSFKALFLMTDGVSDAIFKTDTNLNNSECWDDFWNKLKNDNDLKHFPHPFKAYISSGDRKLLEWLNFKVPGYHDDRTMIILLPKNK